MDDQKVKASILKAVNVEIDAWLASKDQIDDPMEYEQRLFEHTLKIGRSMLVHSGGTLSKDRNKKKR